MFAGQKPFEMPAPSQRAVPSRAESTDGRTPARTHTRIYTRSGTRMRAGWWVDGWMGGGLPSHRKVTNPRARLARLCLVGRARARAHTHRLHRRGNAAEVQAGAREQVE